jgi:hypothetical protein
MSYAIYIQAVVFLILFHIYKNSLFVVLYIIYKKREERIRNKNDKIKTFYFSALNFFPYII